MTALSVVAQYGPDQLLDSNGRPLANVPVTIKNAVGALATLYQPGAPTEPGYARPTVPNPVVTDQQGVFTFFADPGVYTISATGVTTYTVTIAPVVAAAQFGLKSLPTGRYWAPPRNAQTTSGNRGQGVPYYTRIVIARPITIQSLGIEVTVGGTASVAKTRVGIHNADTNNHLPGTVLLDNGQINTGAGDTGVPGFLEKPIPGNLTLQPGVYFLVAVEQGAPATEPTYRVSNTGADYEASSLTATDITQLPNGALTCYTPTSAGQAGALTDMTGVAMTPTALPITVVIRGA